MDLRPFITNSGQVEKAKELVVRGLLNYQPFIFSDDLEVGAGYEFLHGEFGGMVYWPTVDKKYLLAPGLERLFIKEENKEQFKAANAKLRIMYDGFVEFICKRVGNVSETTFADIGCNLGYFPVSFSSCGAKDAVGYDRGDFTLAFRLFNDILGTKAKFYNKAYSGLTQKLEYPVLQLDTINGDYRRIKKLLLKTYNVMKRLTLTEEREKYDIVVSIAVLCHLSDPLQHLAFLGSIARKAIFIWAPVTDDDDYCLRFGNPNKYYKSDQFPLCFDNLTRPSAKLLIKSLELMGFTKMYEIPNQANGMPDSFYNVHKAILAIRP